MAIRFDTSEYEASHGRKPKGHGMWAFNISAPGRFCQDMFFTPVAMSYTEAKEYARGVARQNGADTVHILP